MPLSDEDSQLKPESWGGRGGGGGSCGRGASGKGSEQAWVQVSSRLATAHDSVLPAEAEAGEKSALVPSGRPGLPHLFASSMPLWGDPRWAPLLCPPHSILTASPCSEYLQTLHS